MIIERLRISHLGVFSEDQSITLKPTKDRPVVLVGGENGAGKTTILEAIQWVLYGTLVRTPRRLSEDSTSYPEYLSKLRHRNATSVDDSYAELVLSIPRGRKNVSVKVKRSIKVGAKFSDRLEVWEDGEQLLDPADSWPVTMDCILPTQLSRLFFFDGEQIEAMADPATSSDFLRTGLNALLGIDLIDQLKIDLSTIERRQLKELTIEDNSQGIADLQKEVDNLGQKLTIARSIDADARTDLDQAIKSASIAESIFQTRGGAVYENRAKAEAEREASLSQRDANRNDLRQLAEGSLPLFLVAPQLRQLHDAGDKTMHAEQSANEILIGVDTLEELKVWLKKNSASAKSVDLVERFREKWVQVRRDVDNSKGRSYGLSTHERINGLLQGGVLDGLDKKAGLYLQRDKKLTSQMDRLAKKIATSPDDADIEKIHAKLTAAIIRRADAKAKLNASEDHVRRITYSMDQALKALRDSLSKSAANEVEAAKVTKIASACEDTRSLLDDFRAEIVKNKLSMIEREILLKFKRLAKKKALTASIRIDTKSYELSIIDSNGNTLPAERLSAGERQLLATAVLWGLGSVASRSLPVVIDTPLGRLDTGHRESLVTKYFPKASRQVILLSTDEEIDSRWYPELEDKIAHSYLIEFDDQLDASVIREGYFEEACCAV